MGGGRGDSKVRNIDFKEENYGGYNVEDNMILSSVQENISPSSSSYDQISYPQEEVLSRKVTSEKRSKVRTILVHISRNISYLDNDKKVKGLSIINLE